MVNFDTVIIDSYDDNECSPTFEDLSHDIQGIKINAPQEAVLEFDEEGIVPDSKIPLCVAMQFSGDFIYKFDYIYSHIVVVMVNKRTGESYSANLAPRRSFNPGTPMKTKEELEKMADIVEIMYTNVNLFDYLTLPAKPATYFIYATIEKYKSNTLAIEIKE